MADDWQGTLELSFEVTIEAGNDAEAIINDLTENCQRFLDEREGLEVRRYQSSAIVA